MRMSMTVAVHACEEPGADIACVVKEYDNEKPYPVLMIGRDCTIFPTFGQLAAIRDAITAVLNAREIKARAIVSGEAA